MAVNRLNVGATNQLLAKASSGQSTNILELQNTAGVTVAGVDASGNPVGGLVRPPAFKNLIINGDMQVAQRSSSVASITTGGYYTADRWNFTVVTQGTWTMSQENDAPTGSGFRKSAKVLCTTADASPAAGDIILFRQFLEGQNLQQIAKGTSSAKELTVSFWVKSNVTGTYIVNFYDNDNTRQVSKSYTVNASATWEKKTITFPADTTGAFDNDNALSLELNFLLGAGTDYTSGTLATSWASYTAANRAVGQTNLAASTNNYWQVTGVQLEVGSTATEFEFLPADVELAQCQRYYYRISNASGFESYGLTFTYSTTKGLVYIKLPTTMRVYPTSLDSPTASSFRFNYPGGANNVLTALTLALSGVVNSSEGRLEGTVASGLTAGGFREMLSENTAAYIGLSAEL
jgi:hypothetical protein